MIDLYTTPEAAKKLGIARNTIGQHIANHSDLRRLCRKISRVWLLTLPALEWLKNRAAPGRPKILNK